MALGKGQRPITGFESPPSGEGMASHQLRAERIGNQFELLVDSAVDYAICMLDPHGNVVIWNKGAERMFGWRESEVLGQNHSTFFPAGQCAAGLPVRHLAAALEHGKIEDHGLRLRKDGTEFLASVTLTGIRDALGQEIGFGKVVRDISDEQLHADAIAVREAHFEAILAAVPDAMVVVDERGTIVSFSPAAERMFGYRQDEVLGRPLQMMVASSDFRSLDDYQAQYHATGEKGLGQGQLTGLHKNGVRFHVQYSLGLAVSGGQCLFTAFLHDLTEHEVAETRLQEIQHEMLHLTRISAMGAMASTLAHELNQPLTAVANYVQTAKSVLEESGASTIPFVLKGLTAAASEVLRAGEIVRRLRDFVARGTTEKDFEPVAKLISESCLLGLAGASVRGIVSRVEVDPTLGLVYIDRVQIEQVLVNLMRNAVEAMAPSGHGEISIAARADGDHVRITVADTGPGISREVSERLFTAFVSTKPEGMGLGLSICRTIVEAHGGRIWFETAPGGGAAFHFTVPLAEE